MIPSRMTRTRLSAPGLYLRPPTARDERAWVTLRRGSAEFLKPWEPAWPTPGPSLRQYRAMLHHVRDNWTHDHGYRFMIFRNSDNRLMGGIALNWVRRGILQSAELGYWVGAPYAGHGVMRSALPAVCHFGFTDLTLQRITAGCLPENQASRRLLERCGFILESVERQSVLIGGNWRDHVKFARLRSDPPLPDMPAPDFSQPPVADLNTTIQLD